MSFSINVRVYYEDTDAAGVVYYANYLRFIERARTDWLRQLGFDQKQLLASRGIAFAVRSLEAEYLKPARLDDELVVSATIVSVGGVQMMFEQTVTRGDEVLFTAKVRVACFDPVAARPMAIPEDMIQKLSRT
jgi:acyl-CoA thioester hydrolase